MSWDLSSEEVICNKLESQQTVIFAFSKKIKDLEAKNVELENKLSHANQIMTAMTKTSQNNFEIQRKLKIAVMAMSIVKEGYILPNGALKKLSQALEAINGEGV